MKLSEHWKAASWPMVSLNLLAYYAADDEAIDAHHRAWEIIKGLDPAPDQDGVTTVVLTQNVDDEDSHVYFDVAGMKDPAEGPRYAIEFMPWENWLDCEVATNVPDLTSAEIVAHCLWEMTFAGFDQTDIQAKADDLKALAAQIDKYHESPETLAAAIERGDLISFGDDEWQRLLHEEEDDDSGSLHEDGPRDDRGQGA